MSDDDVSPRVNAARLKDFVGASHPIRMTGKVLNVRPLITPIHFTAPRFSRLCPSPVNSFPTTKRTLLWRPLTEGT